jgi:DNA topoisomerase-1
MTRLRHSTVAGRGYRRFASGRGFAYRDPNGKIVRDAGLRRRFQNLAIPPAWTDVWICPFDNGHIQATGLDGAGRRQYIYHPAWRERRDGVKYDRALELAKSLPSARRRVTLDLRRPLPDRLRTLAAAFRMLDSGSLRIGSERYAAQHGSRGLATLLGAHARVSGEDVELRFPGKSGQEWSSTIHDRELAAVVGALKRRGPRARLLAFRIDDRWQALAPEDINDYVREYTGGDFTAKDFRTLHGSVAAAIDLARTGVEPTPVGRKRAISHAVKVASEVLGNTPAIARRSYVDPRILDAYEHGETIDPARPRSAETQLRALLLRDD